MVVLFCSLYLLGIIIKGLFILYSFVFVQSIQPYMLQNTAERIFCIFFSLSPSQMDLPAIQLHCLEQKDRSLENHTKDFLDLVYLTHFPNCLLCAFNISSLSKALLSRSLRGFCHFCGVGAVE